MNSTQNPENPEIWLSVRNLSEGKLRGAGYGIDTPASKSYNLLVGEIYQYAAKIILQRLTILGNRVVTVKALPPSKKAGKRIDDWIVTLSNEMKIPVEVKSSTGTSYFRSAFKQIKNAFAEYHNALFIGFFTVNTRSFCARVRKLIAT